MPVDQDLAGRVRATLAGTKMVREVKMFGGIGFMLNGNMLVAVSTRGLLVRVGKDHYREALAKPATRPMVMRGRPMEGYVYADPSELTDQALRAWVECARAFVRTLPPKHASARPRPSKGKQKA